MTADRDGQPGGRGRLRLGAAVLVASIYTLCLVALVAATLAFDIPLAEGEGFLVFPSLWGLFVEFGYYGAPLVTAAGFGWFCRPFPRNFLAVLTVIVLSQGIYSVGAMALRDARAADLAEDARASAAAIQGLRAYEHRLDDANGDGLIERIVLSGEIEVAGLPPGDYAVAAQLSQAASDAPLHFSQTRLALPVGASAPVAFTIALSARRFQEVAGDGPLEVSLEVTKDRRLSRRDRTILTLCAWAPYFCATTRLGLDRAIYDRVLSLKRFEAVGRVALAATEIQREQVIFKGFAGDFGRDLDGNGRFDELVVALELDSIYQGPIFFQAQIQAPFQAILHHETRIAAGQDRLEFVIDGAALSQASLDGPYDLGVFVLMNNDPYCPGGVCPPANLPKFSVYLDSYTTGSYRAGQFE